MNAALDCDRDFYTAERPARWVKLDKRWHGPVCGGENVNSTENILQCEFCGDEWSTTAVEDGLDAGEFYNIVTGELAIGHVDCLPNDGLNGDWRVA